MRNYMEAELNSPPASSTARSSIILHNAKEGTSGEVSGQADRAAEVHGGREARRVRFAGHIWPLEAVCWQRTNTGGSRYL